MLLTHAVKQSLTVLGIVDYAQRLIFVCQLLQRLGNLIDIRLVNRFIALCSIRLGIFGLRISNRICLGGKRITGLRAGQLCKCTEVAGMPIFVSTSLSLLYIVSSVLSTPEQTLIREYLPMKGSEIVL